MTETTYAYIAGVDPSLTATGIAWPDGHTTTVRSKRGRTGDARLLDLADSIGSLTNAVGRGRGLVVIEDLPTHAHGAGLTGMAQGVIRETLLRYSTPYVTVPAATLKKYACGKGNATKPDMRMAMYQRAGIDCRDDNQVDAWWLRQLGLYAACHPDAIPLPKAHREAALKVSWPDHITARLLAPYEVPVPLDEVAS